MTKSRSLVVSLAGSLLTGVGLAAQVQSPTFVASTDVLLLDVPVTDAAGRPILDLKPDDFTVQVGEARLRVLNADVLVSMPTSPRQDDGVTTNDGADERVLVIVSDLHGDASDAQRVVSRLGQVVDAVSSDLRVGLVSLSDAGTRVRPQRDRRQLRDALLRELQSGMSAASEPGRQFDVSLDDAWRIADGDQQRLREVEARVCPEGPQRATCGHELETSLRTRVGLLRGRAESALARFSAAILDLRLWPGRKDVVLVTGGWPLEPQDAATRVSELSRAAAAAGVTVHTLLTARRSSVSVEARQGAAVSAGDRAILQQPVESLAAATGGAVLPEGTGALTQVLQESAVVYRLGIEGPLPERQRQGQLRVRVGRSGARTGRHRQVLVPRATGASVTLAEALQQAIPAAQVQLRVASAAVFEANLGERVRHVVSTKLQGARGATEIGWLILDDRGAVVTSKQATIDMTAAASRVVTTHLDLPRLRYQLRIGARDSAGALGTVVHTLDGASRPAGALSSARLAVLSAEPQAAPLLEPVAPGTELVVRADVASPREPAEATLTLQRIGDADSSLILPALESTGQERWTLTATLPAPAQPGRYLVTAQVDGAVLETRFDVRP